jgi:hypothetical protein
VALVKTAVSEERIVSVIRMEIIELGNYYPFSYLADCFHPDDGGDAFLRNIGSYESHTASHPRNGILHSHRCDDLK